MKLQKIDRYITAQERKHAKALLEGGAKVGQWYKVNNSKYLILTNNNKVFKIERRYISHTEYWPPKPFEKKSIIEFKKVT